MVTNHIPDSFSIDADVIVDGPSGQRAHRDLVAHTERLQRKLWEVRPGVRASELEGTIDISRHRVHRFSPKAVLSNPPAGSDHGLRVLVDPAKAAGYHGELRWDFASGESVGLQLRDQVAIPTDGTSAELAIGLELATWANLVCGRLPLDEALESEAVAITGSADDVRGFFACFDHATLG